MTLEVPYAGLSLKNERECEVRTPLPDLVGLVDALAM